MKTIKSGKHIILVDDDNFTELSSFQWKILDVGSGKLYAYICVGGSMIYMHRVVMCAAKGVEVDHIDNNGLNNQKSNLVVCSHSNNLKRQKIRSTNTSGFKGVSFAKREGKFHAYIMVNGINKSLGYYEDPREAAYAYDAAAQKYFGGFAMTNKELGVL